MKRRTKTELKREQKRQARKAANYKSLGCSRYGRKVFSGQMYGPAPTKEQVNRLVGRDARVREG